LILIFWILIGAGVMAEALGGPWVLDILLMLVNALYLGYCAAVGIAFAERAGGGAAAIAPAR